MSSPYAVVLPEDELDAGEVLFRQSAVGLPMTLRTIVQLLERAEPDHPLRAYLQRAIETRSFTQMFAALAEWHKLPHRERDHILHAADARA